VIRRPSALMDSHSFRHMGGLYHFLTAVSRPLTYST
jgi:hypothetical protein